MSRNREIFLIFIFLTIFSLTLFGKVNSQKKVVLKNGLTICVIQDLDTPVTAMHVLFKNRSYNEGKEKAGMVDLIHRMFVTDKVRDRLMEIGAEIQTNDLLFLPFDDYYTTNEFSFIRFKTLNEFYKRGIKLLSEIVLDPDLSESNFNRAKAELLRAQSFYSHKPQKIGIRKFYEIIAPGSYLTYPIYGTKNSVMKLTLQDVKTFFKKYFNPSNTIITVYTANSPESILNSIEADFGKWSNSDKMPKKFIMAGINTTTYGKSVLVKSKARGIGFFCGGYAINLKKGDEIPLKILMSIFSDKYSFLLREKYGLAYSVGASFSTLNCRKNGVFLTYIITEKKNLDRVTELTKEFIKKFESDDFTKKEFEISKNRMMGKLLRRFIPSLNKAYFMGIYSFCDRKCADFFKMIDRIDKVKFKDVLRVMKLYFSSKKFNYVTVK